MSVLVTMRVQGDTEQFRRLLADQPQRFSEIVNDAQAAGCIHHRFGVGDGFVMIVDEWESSQAFQTFFQTNEKIPAIMRDAGASQAEPEVVFTEAIESPDQF
jgi:hypothetical protein